VVHAGTCEPVSQCLSIEFRAEPCAVGQFIPPALGVAGGPSAQGRAARAGRHPPARPRGQAVSRAPRGREALSPTILAQASPPVLSRTSGLYEHPLRADREQLVRGGMASGRTHELAGGPAPTMSLFPGPWPSRISGARWGGEPSGWVTRHCGHRPKNSPPWRATYFVTFDAVRGGSRACERAASGSRRRPTDRVAQAGDLLCPVF
jgi:hypothetical protein